MSKIIKILILLAIFSYLFYNVNFNILLNVFTKYRFIDILPTFLMSLVSYFMLSLRFNILSNNYIKLKSSIESVLLCLGVNNMLPMKLGEIAKSLYLKKIYNLKISKTMPVMIVERFLDIIMISFLIFFASFYTKISNFYVFLFFAFIGIIILLTVIKKSKTFMKLILKYSPKKSKKFFTNSFKTLVRINVKTWVLGIFFSSVLWGFYYINIYLLEYFATDFNLQAYQVLVVFVFYALSISVPSTPGGIGVVQAGTVFSLGLFGINKEEALAFAIIFQLIQLIPTIIASLCIIFSKNFRFKDF